MPQKRYAVKRLPVIQPSDQSYRLIPLTRGQNAIVDAADFEWLSQWNWQAFRPRKTKELFYARRSDSSGLKVMMHSLILGCAPGEQGDHRNNDTLDNRRNNLRKCTNAQNNQNLGKRKTNHSGYKGVVWDKARNKWKSEIRYPGNKKYLGRFSSKEDAARAYDDAAKIYHGEFAKLNFPQMG